MTSEIKALPTEVIHLMAAGEVIDSLAAVVRELAENALDAGATRISIGLWLDQWRVRVADNGKSMAIADLHQAAMPHSTSKIQRKSDLWQISSLGFRGEALHSLAQLSDLEICSRPNKKDEGWHVAYNHQGNPVEVKTLAIAPGTIVTASQIFGNWLPRRQSVPPSTQQLRTIQLTVQHLALCHPHVTWQVEQSDRPWFVLWASPSPQQILPQILREVESTDLREISLVDQPNEADLLSLPDQAPGIYLLLGLPDRCHRHRPDWVKVAVNGRVVKVPELEQTIFSSLRRTLPRDRHPVCFVHLQVPTEQIDWNRHPAKTEIYLQNLADWQEQISQAIAQTLQLSSSIPDSLYTSRVSTLIKAAEAQGNYGVNSSTSQSATDSSTGSFTESSVAAFRAIAQVRQMYILVEHSSGMWLVEQHIAHERVLYEELRDRWQLVPVEPPVTLSQLSAAQIQQLERIGILVEPFGEQLWAARTVPLSLAQRQDCADALVELSQGGDLESALVATACRTAIRNGTPLSLSEMQNLIEQWQATRNPRTCPHGRPIYLPLEESSLSRFFRRHWVVGKSHGI
ncbi:MAG: DNA mismatch repair endonuclease MutL [Timaviella obliquedivisa GSE-PSE-MK23-08B]|jgi:DNA mismatch repair protein MutL|nr:DNA mismatch repair endonuclease MutL [Timaviella obliquedivisa GSE-PSE-MK23-08B]